jgi:carbon storage regulator CsrA
MLVLSRKHKESVMVGADAGCPVRVTVLEIGQGRVRLGFEAQANVPVHREEVWEQIHPSRPRDPPFTGSNRTESNGAVGSNERAFRNGKRTKPEVRG